MRTTHPLFAAAESRLYAMYGLPEPAANLLAPGLPQVGRMRAARPAPQQPSGERPLWPQDCHVHGRLSVKTRGNRP